MQNDSLIHLKRITLWNGKDYNPQVDKFFIDDALWLISTKIKPYELTPQEIESLKILLKKITDREGTYKLIKNIEKNYLKK